jgi:hypothetical protein
MGAPPLLLCADAESRAFFEYNSHLCGFAPGWEMVFPIDYPIVFFGVPEHYFHPFVKGNGLKLAALDQVAVHIVEKHCMVCHGFTSVESFYFSATIEREGGIRNEVNPVFFGAVSAEPMERMDGFPWGGLIICW